MSYLGYRSTGSANDTRHVGAPVNHSTAVVVINASGWTLLPVVRSEMKASVAMGTSVAWFLRGLGETLSTFCSSVLYTREVRRISSLVTQVECGSLEIENKITIGPKNQRRIAACPRSHSNLDWFGNTVYIL